MDIKELGKPLDRSRVAERKQGFANVSYIEGWWAIAEANRIFGFDGWDRVTVYNKEISRVEKEVGKQKKAGFKVGYEACVKIIVLCHETGSDVVRFGTGHGSGISTDLFDCIEGAAKEAETDAMKRALMTFGNPFGLALYDKTRANVAVVVEMISVDQVTELADLMRQAEVDAEPFFKHFRVESLEAMPASTYSPAKVALNKRIGEKQ